MIRSLIIHSIVIPGILAGGTVLAQPCLRDADGDGHPLFGAMFVRPDLQLIDGQGMSTAPTHVVLHDLDGDGDLDAVFAMGVITGYITVSLNRGDGVFDTPTPYTIGGEVPSVAVGDFSGDGLPDIAAVNSTDDTVLVFFNIGGAIFAEPVVYGVGDFPRSALAADVDGDGDIDLVVLNTKSHDVSLLRNNGDGTFAPEERTFVGGVTPKGDSHPLFSYPGPHFAAGDVDGDGDIDLAVPAKGLVKVLLNDGKGNFSLAPAHPSVVGSDAYHVLLRDLDGDGDLDIATSVSKSGVTGVSVILNRGGGVFGAATPYDAGSEECPACLWFHVGLAAADLDDDGDADLVAVAEYMLEFVILRNNGDGTFAPKEFVNSPYETWFAAAADVNGDGLDDVMTLGRFNESKCRVLLNDGAGGVHVPTLVWPANDTSSRMSHVAVADLDGDGDVDLVAAASAPAAPSDIAYVFRNDGAGNLSLTATLTVPGATISGEYVAIGDLDGDGVPDLVIADTVEAGGFDKPGLVRVFRGLGDLAYAEVPGFAFDDAFPTALALADFDDDGDLDVVAWVVDVYPGDDAAPMARRIAVLLNDGAGGLVPGATALLDDPPGTFPYGGLAVGDFAPGGGLEVFATTGARFTPGTGHLVVSERGGDVVVSASETIATVPASAAALPPTGGTSPLLAVMHNHNTVSAQKDVDPFLTIMEVVDAGAMRIVHAYVDANLGTDKRMTVGKLSDANAVDLVMVDFRSHVRVRSGDGTGAFPVQAAYAVHGIRPEGVAAADFDGDGRMDLAVVGYAVSILFNRACPPCRADCNRDGAVNIFDWLCFSALVTTGDMGADCNRDGAVNIFDFLCFQGAVTRGCT
jgi:hypothetical protein